MVNMTLEGRVATLEGLVRRALTRIGENSGGVTSFNTRTGAVVPAANDYSEADISFTDIATNNASTTKHGYLKKLSNVSTEFLDGTGNFSTPSGGEWVLLDTVTLAVDAASITFDTGLSGYGTFWILGNVINDTTAAYIRFRCNADSGNNYDWQGVDCTTTTVTGFAGADQSAGICGYSNTVQGQINAIFHKPVAGYECVVTSVGGDGAGRFAVNASRWQNSADLLTEIQVYPNTNEFAVGTKLYLFGKTI